MTRKDYVKIATVFANNAPAKHDDDAGGRMHQRAEKWRALVRDMADMLATDNPRFDRARFLAACKAVA